MTRNQKNAANAMRQAWVIAKEAAEETGEKASIFFREALKQAWAEIKAQKPQRTIGYHTINAHLANEQNRNRLKWALAGIGCGNLNKLQGFSDLDSHNRNLINILKAQIISSAHLAGITAQGDALARLVAQTVKTKKAEQAEMRGTLAETLFGIKPEAVY